MMYNMNVTIPTTPQNNRIKRNSGENWLANSISVTSAEDDCPTITTDEGVGENEGKPLSKFHVEGLASLTDGIASVKENGMLSWGASDDGVMRYRRAAARACPTKPSAMMKSCHETGCIMVKGRGLGCGGID